MLLHFFAGCSMEIIFPKSSCMGNDICSFLRKLGPLYLFILAAYLLQVYSLLCFVDYNNYVISVGCSIILGTTPPVVLTGLENHCIYGFTWSFGQTDTSKVHFYWYLMVKMVHRCLSFPFFFPYVFIRTLILVYISCSEALDLNLTAAAGVSFYSNTALNLPSFW